MVAKTTSISAAISSSFTISSACTVCSVIVAAIAPPVSSLWVWFVFVRNSIHRLLRGPSLTRSRTRNCEIDTSNRLIRRQARNFHDGPNFNGSPAPCRDPPGNTDCLVEVLGVDQEVAAQLVASLREWTVGHQPFAVANADTRRRGCWVERPGAQILPGLAE